MLGLGTTTARAAGGTILPDDDETEKPTSHYGGRRRITTPPPPPPVRSGQRTPNPSGGKAPPTPALGVRPVGTAATEVMPPAPPTVPARRPITQPPPIPDSNRKTMLHANQAFPQAASNRSTGGWAAEGMPAGSPDDGDGPSFGGRLSAIPDEPAFAGGFAGRVRSGPTDERGFETGKVALVDDDDDLLPGRRGSSAGKWIVIVALLVMGAAAGVIYMVMNKQGGKKEEVVKTPADAMQVAVVVDAQTTVTPIVDAAAPQDPLDVARAELGRDDEARLKTAMTSLDGKDDPAAQALHARLGVGLAQAMLDRANLLADKSEAEKLRKDAKQLVIDAAPFAQRSLKAKADDASANLAMADVLRLQGKSAREIKRYLDAARAKADKDLARDVALSEALVLVRDGKLEDAKTALTAIDSGDGKLEQSGDVRARFHLALVALAQGKAGDAKPLIAQIVAAAPDHAGARALASRVDTAVARTDPLPPEDGGAKDAGVVVQPEHHHDTPPIPSGASYDALITQGNNAAANTNCTRAMELYAKALDAKPNGVEALAGMGYCHIDRKEFASAHSKFRAALAISPRFEPALFGVAEAYAQQGRKEDAINSFKAYLEIYPGAAKAKRQLEMLGVNLDAPTNPGSAAPPTPQGSGAPPASGSGSDSG
jgi:tetratricopeptide (TPR) repeat protein